MEIHTRNDSIFFEKSQSVGEDVIADMDEIFLDA
jgi:hypothetical protein